MKYIQSIHLTSLNHRREHNSPGNVWKVCPGSCQVCVRCPGLPGHPGRVCQRTCIPPPDPPIVVPPRGREGRAGKEGRRGSGVRVCKDTEREGEKECKDAERQCKDAERDKERLCKDAEREGERECKDADRVRVCKDA